MKKLFVADEDVQFQASVKDLCRKGSDVTPRFFSSSMEILPLIEKEQPTLVFVNLELSDMNDFVMYDLLKKADTQPPIPVIITYAAQSEKDLEKYKKLKFKPEGYYKKAISPGDIASLLTKYLGIDFNSGGAPAQKKQQPAKVDDGIPGLSALDDDDIIFTEVMGDTDDALEPFIGEDGKDHPMADILDEPAGEGKPKEAVFSVSDGPSVDVMEKTRYREQAARLMSLEKQNHFLRTENTRFASEGEALKKKIQDLEKENHEFKVNLEKVGFEDTAEKSRLEKTAAELKEKTSEFQLKSAQFQKKAIGLEKQVEELEANLKTQQDELKKLKETAENEKKELKNTCDDLERQIDRVKSEKADLANRVNDLNDRLTDKQRELIARDHEFEKRLQNEADDLIRETEERLVSEFKEKEERLRADIARLENDKMRLDNAHKDEVNRLKSVNTEQQEQIEGLKRAETQLQSSIAALEEEKNSLTRELEAQKEKIHTLEDEKETIVQQLKYSEEDLSSAIKEKEKSEIALSASVEKLTMELHSMKEELNSRTEMTDEYRNRLDGLGKLLQQALLLTGESSGE